MNQNTPEIKIHELAKAIPEMTAEEYAELKASIKESGQRELGILLDGKVLDGRHRYRACQELEIPFAYRPYDNKRDGLIPELVVLDANLNRRHLTASQRATIAAELAEKIKVERKKLEDDEPPRGGPPSNASKEAAEATGASSRSTERAEQLKKDDPEAFAEVKDGKKRLNTATREAAIKKARADDKRQDLTDKLEEHHDVGFLNAIRDGVVLKTPGHLKKFCELDAERQKSIKNMILKGWTPTKALNYLNGDLTLQSTLGDLINKAIDTPEKIHFTDTVAGWEISTTKIED